MIITKKMIKARTIIVNCNSYNKEGRLIGIGEAIVAIRKIKGKKYYADILDTTKWFETIRELRKHDPNAVCVA